MLNAAGKSVGPAPPPPDATCLRPIYNGLVCSRSNSLIYSNYMSVLGNGWVSTRWLGY